MSSRPKIDSIYDFSEKGLVEVKAWLEPWFTTRGAAAAAASLGTIVSVGQEQVAGPNTTTVIDTANADLNWSHSFGDTLLDYTNPATPTVIAEGLYSFSMVPTSNTTPVGGYWTCDFRVGQGGTAPIMFFLSQRFPPLPGTGANLRLMHCPLWHLPAGAECNVHVDNRTGGSLTFHLDSSYVQAIFLG